MAGVGSSAFYDAEAGELPEVSGTPIDANEGVVSSVMRASAHPVAAFFHVAFKIAAVVAYLMLGWFVQDFVIQFVVTVTLLAFDFWTVKNVTGRLMVGLRWWSDVNEDGSTTWRFETLADANATHASGTQDATAASSAQINSMDARVFWWSLYITPIVWVLLGIVCVLKFHISWLIVVCVAIILSGANLVGYFYCDKEAQKRLQKAVGESFLNAALNRFMPSWSS
ncbi:Golgi apparatus membrane protein tvp23 [Porphyridium purpureum]|uniref:Golgi apparatus membrane protein TVP23 homolog n=1 Tax=Porphyridium purpureum TaxID=35688 RepID=A0A5J4YRE5_PORPP|nr:Golgi apparatus membrane protein tvp23 [Porphyridium purpureum]|eukprot:POR2530..scf296_7